MMLPYYTLYIYEISGTVPDSRSLFKEDFIGCWNEEESSFLFFSQPHDEEVEALVGQRTLSLLTRNILDYKAWQAGEELKPFKVGNLVICPPWENCVIDQEEILIHLDPCVVFGTGYHPTTRCCLEALWEIYQKERPEIVLDLGTGSGILALAAVKWGAKRVLSIDLNRLAIETALRNVQSNRESHRIEVRHGRAEDFIEVEADLVCANLHRQAMEALLSNEAFFEKKWFVLSGLFPGEGDEVERRLNQRAIKTFKKFKEQDWVTIVGLKFY
jgi:ribosomal protein L11 methyltransferase